MPSQKCGGLFVALQNALFSIKCRKTIENLRKVLYNIWWGEIVQHTYSWQKCPKCGNPKMIKTRDDTIIINFPGFCKKCHNESIITIAPKSRIVNS